MARIRNGGNLYVNIDGKIATIEFGHPSSNSFELELLERLTAKFEELSDSEAVSLIILKSEDDDRAFCAGASLDELLAVSDEGEAKKFFGGFAGVINAMRSCKKIILGRVQGKTVGGGVGLAAACDYVFASEAASIKLSELSIGIAPLVIAPAVERKIGKGGLAELSLAPNDWKSAYWGQEKGLYARVFETMADLDREVEHHAHQLASYDTEALETWKKILWEGTDHWNELLPERAAMTGKLALSDFTKNALKKFKEK